MFAVLLFLTPGTVLRSFCFCFIWFHCSLLCSCVWLCGFCVFANSLHNCENCSLYTYVAWFLLRKSFYYYIYVNIRCLYVCLILHIRSTADRLQFLVFFVSFFFLFTALVLKFFASSRKRELLYTLTCTFFSVRYDKIQHRFVSLCFFGYYVFLLFQFSFLSPIAFVWVWYFRPKFILMHAVSWFSFSLL